MATIVQKEDPVLRGKAREVRLEEIGTPEFKKIIKDMQKALASQDDGVAIAAPQIAVPMRIFVVAGKAFDIQNRNRDKKDEKKGKASGKTPDLVCINPVITKLSKEKKWLPEGCLSVRYLYGNVERHARATLTALDEHGKPFTRGGSGLLAQIFQHEVDHLEGTLFIDKAKDIEDIPPEKAAKTL